MDKLKIKYKIDDTSDISNLYELEGGIYVEYNGLVLTRALNAEEDDGYIGNFLFSELSSWIEGIPALIAGKVFRTYIAEIFMAFRFEPKNDQVYFSVVSGTTSDEKYLRIYSMYPRCDTDGCPIPSKLFYRESIRMGIAFSDDIKKNYPWLIQHDELEIFDKVLKEVEDAVEQHYRAH